MYYLLSYLALTIPGVDGKPQVINAPSVVPQGGLEDGGGGATLISSSITILLSLVAVLSLIFLILGGIKWITAAGDKSKLDSARKTIIFAIIGMILAFSSFIIISLVGQQFGITFFGS